MLVNLSLVLATAATLASAASDGPHILRSGRPHAGRAAAQRRADALSSLSSSAAAAGESSSSSVASASSTASYPTWSASTRSLSAGQTSSAAAAASRSAGAASSAVAFSTTGSSAAATATTVPSSSGQKLVAVHYMVGNAYSLTSSDWASDIAQAYEAGFDAFALNLGTDSWQKTQVAAAFKAAAASGLDFKLFFSFDMTVWPCSSAADATDIIALAADYAGHPNYATYQSTGKPIVSTFAGSDCTFGASDWNAGWQTAVKTPFTARTGKPMFFLPSVFAPPATLASADVLDGELNWNGGWPSGDSSNTWWSDDTYLAALGSKAYMAAVSPLFYTHYGKESYAKNWLFKSDNFLFAARWKTLVEQRDRFDSVEALTWNDYGESSYLGPITGDQPNSQAWVDGLDHTALLEINKYYAAAFKTGVYPEITKDVVYLTARPHARAASASADRVGRPTGGQGGPADGYLWTEDAFFALVFARADGVVTLSSGRNSKTAKVTKGVNWLSCALETGEGMTAKFNDIDFTPDFTFSGAPKTYNWNMHVFSSDA